MIVIGGMFASLSSDAQTVYFNNYGAKINVATIGTYLNIDGTFANKTLGAIQNNGTMEVAGDWENDDVDGVFVNSPGTVTSGTVKLDGTTQLIGGTAATRFYNLTISEPPAPALPSSNNVKTLNQDVFVGGYPAFTGTTGILHLEDNILELNANDVEVTYNSNLAINSGSGGKIRSETTPLVAGNGPILTPLAGSPGPGYGKIIWDIGTAGASTVYTVPFGNAANNDIKFLYEKITGGTGATGQMKFSTYHTATADNTPWATTVTGLVNDYNQPSHLYVVDRFWNIEHVGYTLGTGNMPQSKYTFKYDDVDLNLAGNTGINPLETSLRPQRFNPYLPPNGGWGDWLFGPTVTPGSNSVQISIANDYGGTTWMGGDYLPVWTLVDESNPLPIELIRFAGNCADGQVEVTWTTASETNNDFFTVQRSIDGVTFEDVVIVDGAGNSSSIINYNAVDYNPYGGTSYYRLKQTDFDGGAKYSDVVAVSCGNAATDFNLVNAYDQGNGTMAVVFNAGDNELYTVTLYDIIGKQITETTGKAYSGKNQINIAVGDLARGIYMVNLKNEFKSFGRRVMLH
jgi:hypothetical protein